MDNETYKELDAIAQAVLKMAKIIQAMELRIRALEKEDKND